MNASSMKMLAFAQVVLVTVWLTCPVASINFAINDFIDDNLPAVYENIRQGLCHNTLEPYFVDFDYKGESYLLWVHNATISEPPNVTRDGDGKWFGDSNFLLMYTSLETTDFTVNYSAAVGVVTDSTYNYIKCFVTASNYGYILSTTVTFERDNTGSTATDDLPGSDWTVVDHSHNVKSFGHWDIAVSCPGADGGLVKELVKVVRREALVAQRDVALGVFGFCSSVVLKDIQISNYITE